jgi:hypothetical protein
MSASIRSSGKQHAYGPPIGWLSSEYTGASRPLSDGEEVMRLVEEALFLWRDAEQLIAEMPPTHPERTELVWIAHRLRRMTSEFSRSDTTALDVHRRTLAELRQEVARFASNDVRSHARLTP